MLLFLWTFVNVQAFEYQLIQLIFAAKHAIVIRYQKGVYFRLDIFCPKCDFKTKTLEHESKKK